MSRFIFMSGSRSKSFKEDLTENIKWNEFSNLYVAATSGNGFTALASKPAASLARRIISSNAKKAESK